MLSLENNTTSLFSGDWCRLTEFLTPIAAGNPFTGRVLGKLLVMSDLDAQEIAHVNDLLTWEVRRLLANKIDGGLGDEFVPLTIP